VIAGGFQTTGNVSFHESHPNSTGTGWVVQGFSETFGPGANNFTAWAVCAFAN
jgi:hypothetical protein